MQKIFTKICARTCLALFILMISALASSAETVTVNGLNYEIGGDTAVVASNTSATGDIVIPATIEYDGATYRVTTITAGAFCGTDITSIKLNDGLNVIEEGAFGGCDSLTSVTLPSGLKAIGYGAFEGCGNLISVTIPGSVTTIESDAFGDCRGLESVTLSEGIKTIGYNAFSQCVSLKSVTIPGSVTSMDASFVFRALQTTITNHE